MNPTRVDDIIFEIETLCELSRRTDNDEYEDKAVDILLDLFYDNTFEIIDGFLLTVDVSKLSKTCIYSIFTMLQPNKKVDILLGANFGNNLKYFDVFYEQVDSKTREELDIIMDR